MTKRAVLQILEGIETWEEEPKTGSVKKEHKKLLPWSMVSLWSYTV